jgi:hypothetical protein
MVNIFEQHTNLDYKLTEKDVAVAEYCVIGEVEVTNIKAQLNKQHDIRLTQ